MKKLLFLLLMLPLFARAQPDSPRPIRPTDLKPIGSDLVPGYYGGRYGYGGVRTRYTYDGIDVGRVTDLEKYIRASGDVDANAEYDRFIARRETGTVLVLVGTGAVIGGLIGITNARSDNNSSNPFQGPARSTTGPSGAGGFLVSIAGAVLIGVGWNMRLPGQHVRRAVQYYNRALKQQQPGVSWKLQPYSALTNSGVGLVGRF